MATQANNQCTISETNTVRYHLKRALAPLDLAKVSLEHALHFAEHQGYHSNWIAAIEKALNDNQLLWVHINNTAHLVIHPDESYTQQEFPPIPDAAHD